MWQRCHQHRWRRRHLQWSWLRSLWLRFHPPTTSWARFGSGRWYKPTPARKRRKQPCGDSQAASDQKTNTYQSLTAGSPGAEPFTLQWSNGASSSFRISLAADPLLEVQTNWRLSQPVGYSVFTKTHPRWGGVPEISGSAA